VRDAYVNDDNAELFAPLQKYEYESEKMYADGSVYNDSSSFAFNYNPTKRWVGQCLYLKYSVGMSPRDDKYCKTISAYMCKWIKPKCPPGYVHGGHAYDGYTCIAVLAPASNHTGDMCLEPAVDRLRRPAAPQSFEAAERLTYLMT
jgi:hypothetical protein